MASEIRMKTAGIDIGSITAKVALVENGKIIATKIILPAITQRRPEAGFMRRCIEQRLQVRLQMWC